MNTTSLKPPLGRMVMWTIYDHPRDYPDAFVARKWLIGGGPEPGPTDEVMTAATLDELRRLMFGLACIPRWPEDDPCIVEVWL
jgi:hypothetical protein